ncbi:hypothetical protein ON010_g10967 [Phytophthora cinnamomi]|nr:hypothetical protein ON010_g10967 [Phytophthora cinnamomi]
MHTMENSDENRSDSRLLSSDSGSTKSPERPQRQLDELRAAHEVADAGPEQVHAHHQLREARELAPPSGRSQVHVGPRLPQVRALQQQPQREVGGDCPQRNERDAQHEPRLLHGVGQSQDAGAHDGDGHGEHGAFHCINGNGAISGQLAGCIAVRLEEAAALAEPLLLAEEVVLEHERLPLRDELEVVREGRGGRRAGGRLGLPQQSLRHAVVRVVPERHHDRSENERKGILS